MSAINKFGNLVVLNLPLLDYFDFNSWNLKVLLTCLDKGVMNIKMIVMYSSKALKIKTILMLK